MLGRVFDDRGGSVSSVEVRLVGSGDRSTLTDAEGRFVMAGIPPGAAELRFARLGYAARTVSLIVRSGRTVEVTAVMSTESIELAPIEVTVRPRYLENVGFYDRQERGFGRHLDREDLDAMLVFEVSDALMRMPGIRLSDTRMLGFQPVFAETTRVPSVQGPCVLPVYVDGTRQASPDLNRIPASFVEAMEVYVGPETPAQYRGGNPCGVVLIWTTR